MKSFLRKDLRSFYFVFCLLFSVAFIIYYLVSKRRENFLAKYDSLTLCCATECMFGRLFPL